jgi:hypothetical protein
MAIDLNALSGRIKAEEAECDRLRDKIASSVPAAGLLESMLAHKEKWLRENRALYAQECEARRLHLARTIR